MSLETVVSYPTTITLWHTATGETRPTRIDIDLVEIIREVQKTGEYNTPDLTVLMGIPSTKLEFEEGEIPLYIYSKKGTHMIIFPFQSLQRDQERLTADR